MFDTIVNFLVAVYNHLTTAQFISVYAAVKVLAAAWRAKIAVYDAKVDAGIKTALAKLKGEAAAVDAKVDSFLAHFWAEIKKVV